MQHPCFAESEAGSKTAEQFWPVSRQICESDTCAGAAAAAADDDDDDDDEDEEDGAAASATCA